MSYQDRLKKAAAAIASKKTSDLNPRGDWSEKSVYTPNDLVYHEGKTYICLTASKGDEPANSDNFVIFAANGKDGLNGREIELGATDTHICWKFTGDLVWRRIISLDKLVGPEGEQGDQGKQGIQGKEGVPGKQVQLRKTDTAIEWRYEGGTWIVLVLLEELKGPKGDKGDDGKSAYDIWKEQGNKGGPAQFLESLRGRPGGTSVARGGGILGIQSIVAGSNITIDNSDPRNPIISSTGGSGGVSDGDKGDITVSSSGTVWTIDSDAVSNAKLANMAESTIKGRAAGAGTGDPTDLTPTQVRTMINVEDGADVTDAANVDAAGATMNADTTLAGNGYFLDEDNMASDSATKVPSQQSVKAYADLKLAKASNLSDVANAATSFNNIKQAATDSATGVVELATQGEVDAGTDTTRVLTPDTLAGSYAGIKPISIQVLEGATALTTGDGKAYFRIPPALNGMNIVSVGASVLAKSTSGNPTIQIARGRQANATSAHTFADVLSTRITIDANDFDSKDAGTPPVIDTSNDDLLTGDLIRIDVDVAGTGTTGLFVTLQAQLP